MILNRVSTGIVCGVALPLAVSVGIASLGHTQTVSVEALLAQHCPNTATYTDNTQLLVNEANQLADSGDALAAMCRYQIAVKRLPGNAQLKNNFSVLAFNHAMQLNEAHNYAQARQFLQISQQLNPTAPEATEALAVTYVNEASYRREHDATPDWAAYEALLRQGIALQPQNPIYKKHLASFLTLYGRDLAHHGEFTQAEAKLTEAKQLDTHPAIENALANVYLQQARTAEKGSDAQKALLDKALALNPDIKPLAEQIKKGETPVSAPNTALLNTQPTAADLPLEDKITAMEQLVGLTPATHSDLPHRLSAIEKQLYGNDQKGGLLQRTERAYLSLVGSGQTLEHSPTELTTQIQTVEGTYLQPILTNTQGRVIRWARFPLAVHVAGLMSNKTDDEPTWQGPLPKNEALQAIKNGVERWVWGTDEFITVVWVNDETTADVVIKIDDTPYTDRFANPQTAAVLPDYTLPKTSKLAKALGLASMFVPGYYGLAPKAGAAALQYREAQKIDRVKEESEIQLGHNVMQTPEQLANATAYEFGHVLGLKAASPNPEDLLHPETPFIANQPKPISLQDKATLKALYERPAAIILNLQ